MTTTTSRRGLLAASAALAGASAVNVAAIASSRAATDPDPVYAAIEAHRTAEAEFCQIIRLDDRTPKAGPARVAFQAAYEAHQWSDDLVGWTDSRGREVDADFLLWLLDNVRHDVERLTAGGVAS